jgi:hypothetical protein
MEIMVRPERHGGAAIIYLDGVNSTKTRMIFLEYICQAYLLVMDPLLTL